MPAWVFDPSACVARTDAEAAVAAAAAAAADSAVINAAPPIYSAEGDGQSEQALSATVTDTTPQTSGAQSGDLSGQPLSTTAHAVANGIAAVTAPAATDAAAAPTPAGYGVALSPQAPAGTEATQADPITTTGAAVAGNGKLLSSAANQSMPPAPPAMSVSGQDTTVTAAVAAANGLAVPTQPSTAAAGSNHPAAGTAALQAGGVLPPEQSAEAAALQQTGLSTTPANTTAADAEAAPAQADTTQNGSAAGKPIQSSDTLPPAPPRDASVNTDAITADSNQAASSPTPDIQNVPSQITYRQAMAVLSAALCLARHSSSG